MQSYAGETLVFAHNPGNAGDNIINLGTYRLFERLGVKFEDGSVTEDYPDRVVIYSGGGALIPLYAYAGDFLRRNHPICKALILLPHTVRDHPDMLAEMDERCHLFTREEPSYDYVSKHCSRANVYKSHDLAFMLDKAYIDSLRWHIRDIFNKGHQKSWLAMLVKFNLIGRFKDSTLHSMRKDREAERPPEHPRNFDMSVMFTTDDMRVPSCTNVAKALQMTFSGFQKIETNRLHIAILAAILGRNVDIYDNNYGKVSSIYEHSMRGIYPNARLMQTFGDTST